MVAKTVERVTEQAGGHITYASAEEGASSSTTRRGSCSTSAARSFCAGGTPASTETLPTRRAIATSWISRC